MKVKEYKVIYETVLDQFMLQVRRDLDAGWELNGPMTPVVLHDQIIYMREMVKYDKEYVS